MWPSACCGLASDTCAVSMAVIVVSDYQDFSCFFKTKNLSEVSKLKSACCHGFSIYIFQLPIASWRNEAHIWHEEISTSTRCIILWWWKKNRSSTYPPMEMLGDLIGNNNKQEQRIIAASPSSELQIEILIAGSISCNVTSCMSVTALAVVVLPSFWRKLERFLAWRAVM